MGKCCVVQFCENSSKTGHSTHLFPKEENLRLQWLKFVQVKRADFLQPTVHSIICGLVLLLSVSRTISRLKWALKRQEISCFLVLCRRFSHSDQKKCQERVSGLWRAIRDQHYRIPVVENGSLHRSSDGYTGA